MNTLIQKNSIAIIIVLTGIIAAGAIFYFNGSLGRSGAENLTAEQAGQKAIEFINQSIDASVTASLLEVMDQDLVYKIRLDIEGTEYESYITKDGKFLFPTGFELQDASSAPEETVKPADLAAFTSCLADRGKFYGAFWCTWCNSEKELFAESAPDLPYIECSDQETREMLPVCQEAGVTSFPTWEFNGELTSGFKTFEELSSLSGCPLQ